LAKVLVVASMDSPPTVPTYLAATEAEGVLAEGGHEVDRLYVWAATRPFFEWRGLSSGPYDGVFYFGHGLEDALVGQLPLGLWLLMCDLANAHLLRGSVVVTVACLSGLELGPTVVGLGARAYTGSRHYMYVGFPMEEHDYSRDFMDTWLELVRVLAEGSTIGDAYEAYLSKCDYYVGLYAGMLDSWPNADAFLAFMRFNRDYYSLYGDPRARL